MPVKYTLDCQGYRPNRMEFGVDMYKAKRKAVKLSRGHGPVVVVEIQETGKITKRFEYVNGRQAKKEILK